MAGTYRVVLPRNRRTEQRQDAVTHHLAHRAAVLFDRFAHVLDDRPEQLADLLGVAIGNDLQRALEVREQYRDEFALTFERRGCMQKSLGCAARR